MASLTRVGRSTVDELVPTVYADVDEERFPVARNTLWAHLRKLHGEGAVLAEDPDDIEGWWESSSSPTLWT